MRKSRDPGTVPEGGFQSKTSNVLYVRTITAIGTGTIGGVQGGFERGGISGHPPDIYMKVGIQ